MTTLPYPAIDLMAKYLATDGNMGTLACLNILDHTTYDLTARILWRRVFLPSKYRWGLLDSEVRESLRRGCSYKGFWDVCAAALGQFVSSERRAHVREVYFAMDGADALDSSIIRVHDEETKHNLLEIETIVAKALRKSLPNVQVVGRMSGTIPFRLKPTSLCVIQGARPEDTAAPLGVQFPFTSRFKTYGRAFQNLTFAVLDQDTLAEWMSGMMDWWRAAGTQLPRQEVYLRLDVPPYPAEEKGDFEALQSYVEEQSKTFLGCLTSASHTRHPHMFAFLHIDVVRSQPFFGPPKDDGLHRSEQITPPPEPRQPPWPPTGLRIAQALDETGCQSFAQRVNIEFDVNASEWDLGNEAVGANVSYPFRSLATLHIDWSQKAGKCSLTFVKRGASDVEQDTSTHRVWHPDILEL